MIAYNDEPWYIMPVGGVEDEVPEEEIDWRCEDPAWATTDFFEVLKNQFRSLRFIPLDSGRVVDIYITLLPRRVPVISILQNVYRQHGWPDGDYHQGECLNAIEQVVKAKWDV